MEDTEMMNIIHQNYRKQLTIRKNIKTNDNRIKSIVAIFTTISLIAFFVALLILISAVENMVF